jgi:hypothetical protein
VPGLYNEVESVDVHWTKAKPIRKRQTHLLDREDVHKDYDRKASVEKKPLVVGLKGLGAKTDRLMGGKPPVVK